MSIFQRPTSATVKSLCLASAACLSCFLAPAAAAPAQLMQNFMQVTNLHQLRDVANRNVGGIWAINLTGTVLAADPASATVFLHDESGTEILEFPEATNSLAAGQVIHLSGTNYLAATEFGVSLGKNAVIENDGMHSKAEGTATLFLKAGCYPLELHWFNNVGDWFLELDYSGPGFSRTNVPPPSLFHSNGISAQGRPVFSPGLHFQCYEGEWRTLPPFENLKPVKTGIASKITPDVQTRDRFIALAFDGFLQVDQDGPYTFYLLSDDGSRLFLNHTPLKMAITGTHSLPAPEPMLVKQPADHFGGPRYVTTEGQLTFLGRQQDDRTELELTSDDAHMRVLLLDPSNPGPKSLLGARVRLRGVCIPALNSTGHQIADLLVVSSWKDVEILSDAMDVTLLPAHPLANTQSPPTLTTAAQVQQLTREAARAAYPVRLTGVVTWTSLRHDCVVLQDATRGVFVGLRSNWKFAPPNPGDILQIEGYCNPAEFSPIVILTNGNRLGRGLFPPPIHPSWEQLIGGSLDDQYIEISGLVTASRDANHFTLLLPGGEAELEFERAPDVPLVSFLNSVVRIRGVMFANWDLTTHMVTPSQPLRFDTAVICEDVPPPADPFDADRMRAPQLMQFDARRNTFQRVKVSAQLLCQRGDMCFLTDGGFGFRVELAKFAKFEPGDMLDVVGLVELGGPSPVLREALARKIGQLPLPSPTTLAWDQTNMLRDSSPVVADGLLLGVKDTGAEKVLQMQSGLNHFVARLPADSKISWPAGCRLKLTGTLSVVAAASTDGQGVNSAALLLNSTAAVEVLARPPWWTLGRLLTIVAILTLGLGFAFVWITLLRAQVERRSRQLQREISERQRAEQERAIERERSRIALDLHDDLGSRLTAISMLATAPSSRRSAETSQERLQLIADKARVMVTTLDGLVWAVDPKNDTVVSLAEYLAAFTEEFLARTGIEFHIDLPAEFPPRTVAAEARHNVLLAVREALNNSVRHGHPKEINLQLSCSDNKLSITLSDNGCGFDPQKAIAGNGLMNFKERLAKVNGQCRIESSPGHGTTIVLTLPL